MDTTLGLSLSFDGVKDFIVIPLIPRNNFMTISAWIKTSSTNDQQILSWGNTRNGNRIEFKTNGGRLYYAETDIQPVLTVNSPKPINTGNWEHVAVVVREDEAQLYINGKAGFAVKGLHRDVDVNTLTIGAYQVGPDFLQSFNGGIDDVQLWNKPLTLEEIKENMLNGLTGSEDGLVAYWSFNDSTRSTGKIAGDYARKGNNHGTIIGANWSNEAAPVAYRDLTEEEGEFRIANLFYDESREFRVTPYKEDHLFDPEFRDIILENGGGPKIAFNDTTVFTLSGQILFSGNSCPVAGVELLVDGKSSGVFTDSQGKFEIAIEEPGKTYTIKPQYGDSISSHTFNPSEISLFVEGDIDGLKFTDIEKHLLYGKVRGGCIAGLGVAKLHVKSSQKSVCLDDTITTDHNGNYRLFLPAQEYLIELVQIDNPDSVDIKNYFSTETVDITWENKNRNFIYHPEPIIRWEILPTELTCDTIPILKQNNPYSVIIDVLEAYQDDTCHVAEGFVTIFDNIGGNPAEPVVIELENGRAIYTFSAGEPNILGGGDNPYQKLMQIEATVDDYSTTENLWALVTGHRPRTQTFFSSATPELPFMILRDPPGDQSYSFLSKDSTYTTNFSTALDSSRVGPRSILPNFIDVKAGFITGTGWGTGPQISTDWGLYGIFKNNRFYGDGKKENYGHSISLSMNEEFKTSDSEAITGARGDVFIGGSLNRTFYLTDVIYYDSVSCKVLKDTTLFLNYTGFKSTYVYTEDHIRNTLIPQLQGLISDTGKVVPDSVYILKEAISVWQQTLHYNDSLKSAAENKWPLTDPEHPTPEYLLEKNISFSGGTSTTQYSTFQKDTSWTITYATKFERDFLIGLGGVAFGTPYEFGFQWKVEAVNDTTRKGDDVKRTQINTIGYTLADNDAGDYFSVDILHDRTFGTPVFNLVAGTSSCPWEDGTQPRDGARLGINSFIQNDVSPDKPAKFLLSLGNISESGESRPYDLRLAQLSNPDGAIVKVGGVAMGGALSYYIPAGDSAYQATITVERGPRAYEYDNLQLIMVPPCEYDVYNKSTVKS